MSIENKLREIAETEFPGFSYVFEDWNGASEVLDRVSLPAIVCVLPVGGYLDMSNGRVKDAENILVAFVDKVVRDANGDDNESVYTTMKDAATDFLAAVNKSRYFEPIEGRVNYTTLMEAGSVNFTGVVLDFSVKQLQGRCV